MVSLAADDFTKAGEKITGVMQEAEALFGQLNHTGQVLSESTKSVQGALQSFASGQERFTAMVEALRSIIDQAKEDAGMNKDVVADPVAYGNIADLCFSFLIDTPHKMTLSPFEDRPSGGDDGIGTNGALEANPDKLTRLQESLGIVHGGLEEKCPRFLAERGIGKDQVPLLWIN